MWIYTYFTPLCCNEGFGACVSPAPRQFLCSKTNLFIDLPELPGPLSVVEELSLVEAVVVRAVGRCVVGGSQHSHLVPVAGVGAEEMLHLGRNLCRTSIATGSG